MNFCNEQLLQLVTCDFLQRATSVTSNKRILQRVMSDFLQWATSAKSNERILQRVTGDFTTSEFQRVTSNESKVMPPPEYVSLEYMVVYNQLQNIFARL